MEATRNGGRRRLDDLVAGSFVVEADQKLSQLGGGVAAFAARDVTGERQGLMALRVRAGAPPRPKPIAVLSNNPMPGLSCPIAHGVGLVGHDYEQFVICTAPVGAPLARDLSSQRRWSESELIACVLRPISSVLTRLHRLGLTHRGIRPDNVLQGQPGQPVTLGAAWAGPPGALQPACFEPAYLAMCVPSGRGDGVIADDVYALGVLLITLAAGQLPMSGLDPAAIVDRKISLGSYAALTSELRLSGGVAELARALLADDPDHRPNPAQLHDAEAIRGRRLALRPARVAPRPLEVGGKAVWHSRGLAAMLAAGTEAGLLALRDGSVERWLRRGLGDGPLASRIEELVRSRALAPAHDQSADRMLVLQAVATLDPLAPVCWNGVAFWPDGLGPLLAGSSVAERSELLAMLCAEAIAAWATARPERCDAATLRGIARDWRLTVTRNDWSGGLALLLVQLNPLERCASALLNSRPVVSPSGLLIELDRLLSARAGDGTATPPLDRACAAFLGGQDHTRAAREIEALSPDQPGAALAQLRLLSRLQESLRLPPLPGLAAIMARSLGSVLAGYRSLSRRARIEGALGAQASAGSLNGMLQVLQDFDEADLDQREAEAAREELGRIGAELAAIAEVRSLRIAGARSAAHRMSASLAAAAVAVVAAALML